MSLIGKIERIERMHQMIQYKRTGSPESFARRLGVSPSKLYQMIRELKALGAPIAYCKYRQSYLYLHPVRFRFGFEEGGLSEQEARQTRGGMSAYPYSMPHLPVWPQTDKELGFSFTLSF